jgi:excisionase family DNA binding protein
MLVGSQGAGEQSPDLAPLPRAAEHLGCSHKTVRRYVAAGDLTGYRVGKRMLRIDMNEVRALARAIPTAQAG